MLLEFEKKLVDFIKANKLLNSAEKVLLSISGGADSTALLHAMNALKDEKVLNTRIFCAHINHQLRGTEGDLDEEFVVTRAKQLKLAVTTRRIDVRGFARLNNLSIETAARQLRIRALIEIAKTNACSRIAMAHQKNDNAETIIQRLSRGTGFRGLAGIWPERVFAGQIKFVRPLLCFTRDEIIDYLQQRNLDWRHDRMNADCSYRRSYIRHRLIPALQQECSDSIIEQLSQLAGSARRYYGVVCKRADELWPDLANCDENKVVLDLKLFGGEAQEVKIELIRRSLANINCGERFIIQEHYENILQLAEQNVTGRKIELPGGFFARREYGNLVFANRRVGLAPPISSTTIEIPGQSNFEKFQVRAIVLKKTGVDLKKFVAAKTNSIEWFDVDKIKPPLTVRHRRAGDRFVPFGLNAEKKLGKFLSAQRIPYGVRRKVLVVADREKIIWIWPVRISEQAKITDETHKILQLQINGLNT